MINVGVIGYGYWGPNVARNFNACGQARLVAVCDAQAKRRDGAKAYYPFVRTSSDPADVVGAADVDVVAVVTPVSTHFELARAALEAGKHVFVEKPFTATSDQARELIDLADRKGRQIMVDHTFLYTGAVRKMREVIDSGELGELYFYDSVRVNLGLFQHDINVLWDLAPHDFSIMTYLIDKTPSAVSALGTVHFQKGLEDVVYVAVEFSDNGFIAHFHCNWLSPVKIRRTLISGDRKMLVWDDLSSDEKIKIYDRGVEFKTEGGIHDLLVSYRSGDMYVPRLDNREALKREIDHFVDCLERGAPFDNDGRAGLKVVRLLEAAGASLREGGRKVKL